MTVLVEREGFCKWIGVAVLVVCATVAAAADTAALLYGNPRSVYLECNSFGRREVIWYHNGSELHAVDLSGHTRYQSVRRPMLDISYPTHLAAGLYQCKNSSGGVLKEYSGVKVYSKLVPDDCTSENLLPCIDVNEVIVVDLPPEQQQRYRISLSYHHSPTGHHPQETPGYPIRWIVEADDYDNYQGCRREGNVPCIIAQCNKHCRVSRYMARGAGLSVSGGFGQVVEVDLTKLVPGGSNGMVELQYHVNLPYRQNAEGKMRNIVILKKYRFNFRNFVPNITVWSRNCSSDHCNVSVSEGGNVTVCSEMGPSSGEGPVPVHSSKWMMSRRVGGKMEMMSQCQTEMDCSNEEGCANCSLVSGKWGKCFTLTNVSMDDNGRSLSYQVRSTRGSKVATVNYTLLVTPTVVVQCDLVLIISASAGGGVLLLLAVCIPICCCCCHKHWCRRKTHTERMVPAPLPVTPLPVTPPPLPPRLRVMEPGRPPSPEHVYIVPLAPNEVANGNGVPVHHHQLRVSGRDERSHPLQEELPLHNGPRSQRTFSLQAQRWSTPPELVPNRRRSYPGP